MGAYAIETPQVDVQAMNEAFLRQLDSRDGEKRASDDGSLFIREYVRQEAAVDDILTPIPLTQAQIDRDENTEEPKKIVEKEPKSYATFVPFEGTPEAYWFTGPRYAVYFGKIVSQKFIKQKTQLMTWVTDIRKVLADNSVKDMSDKKDLKWRNTVIGMIAANPTEQETRATQFSSSAFKRAYQKMIRRRRPIGKMVLTESLFMEAIDLPATSVGNAIAERHYNSNVQGEEKLFGVPTVTTLKTDIYDPDEVLIFSPQDYLGNSFTLQDATLHIKQEADIIEWYTYMILGLGIGNRLSMQRLLFVNP